MKTTKITRLVINIIIIVYVMCHLFFILFDVLFECQLVMDVQQNQNNFYSSSIYLKDRIYLYLGRRSNNVLTQFWPFLLLFHAAVFLGTHIVQGMCCTWWYSISRVMHTQNHTNQRNNSQPVITDVFCHGKFFKFNVTFCAAIVPTQKNHNKLGPTMNIIWLCSHSYF